MGHRLSLYLADACALIDFYNDTPRLPDWVGDLFEDAPERVAVLATTVWEIAIKVRLGKLTDITLPTYPSLAAMLAGQGFELIALDADLAERAAALPPLHKDPFNRALVAGAQRTGRTVLTSDALIGRYGVPVRW